MDETEIRRPSMRLPVGARRLEQRGGAGDIGRDEGRRAVDRSIDMAFGGQMQNGVWLMTGENRGQFRGVPYVGPLEDMARMMRDARDVRQRAGIGQGVEVHHLVGIGDGLANDGRADETRASGDGDLHAASPSTSRGDSNSRKLGAAASRGLRMASAWAIPQLMPISGSSQRTAPSCPGA